MSTTGTLQKVALAGATGNLGPALLQGLLRSGFAVTVLTRDAKKASFAAEVKVAEVDYQSLDSLTAALRGQDVVVSALASQSLDVQRNLIDAAIAAGVSRFVPSEFGGDTDNERARNSPVYAGKVQTNEYMIQKAKEGAITYTAIRNGPFLDWCIMVGLFLNVKEKSIELYDGGDRPFSSTTLESTGKALAAALKRPAESENRVYFVHDAVVTQNQLLKYAKELTGPEWDVKHADTAVIEQASFDGLKKGDHSMGVIMGFLKRVIWGKGYGGAFEKTDNHVLGIDEFREDQIKEVVARYK